MCEMLVSELEPGFSEETSVSVLNSVISDFTLNLSKLAKNCRNIADEVFPGILLGEV